MGFHRVLVIDMVSASQAMDQQRLMFTPGRVKTVRGFFFSHHSAVGESTQAEPGGVAPVIDVEASHFAGSTAATDSEDQ